MRLLAPAAAAVLLLALTGCSEPEPGSPMPTGPAPATSAEPRATAPATTASPTPTSDTPEPTEAPGPTPTLPPEATTNDAAGAEAFVRYWFDVSNDAIASGNVGLMRHLARQECAACEETMHSIEAFHRRGGHFLGGQAVVTDVVAAGSAPQEPMLVAFTLEQEPIVAVGASARTEGPVDEADGPSAYEALLRWAPESSSWKLVDLGSRS